MDKSVAIENVAEGQTLYDSGQVTHPTEPFGLEPEEGWLLDLCRYWSVPLLVERLGERLQLLLNPAVTKTGLLPRK